MIIRCNMGEINDNTRLLIGIYDDEIHIYNTVDKLLSIYAEKNNMVCHLVYYDSAKKLLEAKDKLDLLLLDIEMPEMDGIEQYVWYLNDRYLSDCPEKVSIEIESIAFIEFESIDNRLLQYANS